MQCNYLIISADPDLAVFAGTGYHVATVTLLFRIIRPDAQIRQDDIYVLLPGSWSFSRHPDKCV